jgi:hypothetical protein
MTYGVAVLNKVAATDVDAYNRTAVCATALENGFLVELLTRSSTTGEGEVWVATQSAGTLTNIWMVYSPEVVSVVSGSNRFKGIDNDPRNFRHEIGDMVDVFRPVVGDIITLTADALSSSTVNTYAIVTSGAWEATWGASPASGLTLKYLETTYVSLPQAGAISETQRVAAYKFVVSAVA